jgi:hypothetical protein
MLLIMLLVAFIIFENSWVATCSLVLIPTDRR